MHPPPGKVEDSIFIFVKPCVLIEIVLFNIFKNLYNIFTRDDHIAWLVDKKEEEMGIEQRLIHLFDRIANEIVECGLIPTTSTTSTTSSSSSSILSLDTIEYQLANYGTGAKGYARHLDYDLSKGRKKTEGKNDTMAAPLQTGRYLSMVLYLNDRWSDGQGGDLRLWSPRASSSSGAVGSTTAITSSTSYVDLSPVGGRLVVFLSSSIPHQVRRLKQTSTHQNRMAVTAWVHGKY